MLKSIIIGTAVVILTVPADGAAQKPRPGRQDLTKAQAQQPREGSLKPGDLATDFTLSPRTVGAPVTLSSFRGRQPVALVFGSYT